MAFNILLALSVGPRHGYALMQHIREDSAGQLAVGPGALYSSLKQLCERHFIEELPFAGDDPRRRYYRLTKKGFDRLAADLPYYRHVVAAAKQRHL